MVKATEHVERLKQTFSGPMSEEEVATIKDMQAFLQFCLENGLSSQVAFGTLAHDVNGLLRQERCFVPKVSGYAKILENLHAEQNDPTPEAHLENDDRWD